MGIATIPSPAWAQRTLLSSGFGWFFPQLQADFSHARTNQNWAEYSATLCTPRELSPFLLCYMQTLATMSPWTPSCALPTPGQSQALPQFHIPAPWPSNALQVGSQAITGLISLASNISGVTILHCLRYNVLRTVVSIIFVVSGRKVNLFPVIPIWPESKVIFYVKHLNTLVFYIFR